MTEELKPCPFCGNVPNWFVDVEAQEDEYGQASPNCCEQYSFKTYLGPLVAVSTFTGDARMTGRADKVQAAFAAHWNAMHRASGWISVEDRLPPLSDTKLRYTVVQLAPDGTSYSAVRDWGGGDWGAGFWEEWWEHVTHYLPQPLPELPK